MPRQTTDILVGYAFNCVRGEQIVTDDRGNTVHDHDGAPKVVQVTNLVFVDPETGHRIIAPFLDDDRQELIRMLTGGIVIANGDPTR